MKIYHLEQLVEKMGTELERLRHQGGQQTLQLTGGATISISPGGATILSSTSQQQHEQSQQQLHPPPPARRLGPLPADGGNVRTVVLPFILRDKSWGVSLAPSAATAGGDVTVGDPLSASAAGILQPGDVILAVAGEDVRGDARAFVDKMKAHRAARSASGVALLVERGRRRRSAGHRRQQQQHQTTAAAGTTLGGGGVGRGMQQRTCACGQELRELRKEIDALKEGLRQLADREELTL